MPVDEHGNEYDEDFVPESPILRGEVRVPDDVRPVDPEAVRFDELPHRIRRANGMTGNTPDPGYDPDEDDLLYV